jgi:hypothetical protein
MGTKATCNTADQHNQNPIPERQIALIMRGVRVLLKQSGAPKWFWEFAAAYVVYVSNRTPTRSNQYRVPITCFGGRDGQGDFLKYVKVFCSLAAVHLPKNQRTKLSDTAIKCAFLGMEDVKKGGIFYVLSTKKIIFSRNSYHNETIMPFLVNPVGAISVQPKLEKPVPAILFNTPADFYKLGTQSQTKEGPEQLSPPPPLEKMDLSLPESPHQESNTPSEPYSPSSPELRVGQMLGEPRVSQRTWQPSGQALRNLAHVIEVLEEEQWEVAALASLEDPNCPITYQQAVTRPDAPRWIKAMKNHMEKHNHKGTFEVTDALPNGKRALSCR